MCYSVIAIEREVLIMDMNDYIPECKDIFYKHERTENIPCDAYSMHTHGMYELIYFLDGDATHVIEGKRYKLKKGDLLLIRPFQYHFIQIDSPADYERYNILFDAQRHSVESVSLIPEEIEVISLANNPIADDILRKTDYYRANCDFETFSKLLTHLLSELFYNLSLTCASSPKEMPTASHLLEKALRYINENLCTLRDVKEIAEKLFISESYLYRLFKTELRQTPKKYITDKRLLMAQSMIENGERPASVYEKCGFGDYTAFYRSYKAFFGHAPSALTAYCPRT